MDVLALQVLNALGFDCLSIGELNDADGKFFEFGPLSVTLGLFFRLNC